eukprot:763953-Hanusia_phi.AAC.1
MKRMVSDVDAADLSGTLNEIFESSRKDGVRGPMGEVGVHLIFLLTYGQPNQADIMKKALEHDCLFNLLEKVYQHDGLPNETEDMGIYTGESILHICIANNDEKAVEQILEMAGEKLEALLKTRATGLFFQPKVMRVYDEPISSRDKFILSLLGIGKSHEDYGCDAIINVHSYSQSFACFGEFPLSFAASQGNVEICEKIFYYLKKLDETKKSKQRTSEQEIERSGGSDEGSENSLLQYQVLYQKDINGNNALHIAVLHGHEDVITFLLKQESVLDMGKIQNSEATKKQRTKEKGRGQSSGAGEGDEDQEAEAVDENSAQNDEKRSLRTRVSSKGKEMLRSLSILLNPNDDLMSTPEEEKKSKLLCDPNNSGYTPFTLAVRHGQVRCYQHIIEHYMKDKVWSFGAKRYSRVHLSQLDDFGVKSKLELHQQAKWKSAFEIIVNFELVEFCDDGVFTRLLERKWKACGSIFYFTVLLPYLIYIVLFCSLLHLRTSAYRSKLLSLSDAQSAHGDFPVPVQRPTLIISSVLVFMSSLLLAYGWSTRKLDTCVLQKAKLTKRFWGQLLQSNMLSLLCILTSIMVITSFGLQQAGLFKVELSFLALAALFLFLTLLYIVIPFPSVGKLVMIMEDIMVQDVMVCLCIYLIFMFGFTAALYLMFQNSPSLLLRYGTDFDYTRNPAATAWSLTWNALGDAYMYFHVLVLDCQDRRLGVTLEVIWVILSRILIMNLLIAMMNSRYKKDSEGKNRRWLFHYARMLLQCERWKVICWGLFGATPKNDPFLHELEENPRDPSDLLDLIHKAAKTQENNHAG